MPTQAQRMQLTALPQISHRRITRKISSFDIVVLFKSIEVKQIMAQKFVNDISEGFLQCSICMERYNGNDKKPKSLPCIHSFCLPCLEQLEDRFQRDGQMFSCPICRTVADLPSSGVKGLPVNFLLVSLMEQLSVVDTSGRSPSICSFCRSEQDLQFCIDCKFHICLPCKKTHDKIPGVSEHAVIPIEKLSDEKYMKEIFASQTPRCDKHQEEKLRFYCLPCCMLVCRDCMLLTHQGHNCVEAASRVSSVKEDLQNLLAASETEVVSAQEMNHTFDMHSQSEEENIKKVEKDIDDHYNKVLRQLKSDRDELVLEVRHSPMKMKTVCEEVKNWLAAMTNTKEVTKKILEGNNQWEILGMEKDLSEAFKRLSESQKGLTRKARSQQSSTTLLSFAPQFNVDPLNKVKLPTRSNSTRNILGKVSKLSPFGEMMNPDVDEFVPKAKVKRFSSFD